MVVYSYKPAQVVSSLWEDGRRVLGSYDVITDANGNVVERLSFDAWGNRRKPGAWEQFDTDTSLTAHLFRRGFTGHEHLEKIGAINMNGRLYDPALGRFFSPDPFVADAASTQDFNRYSYARNNPLMYIDPSGEFWHIVIGAAIGGVINLAVKAYQGKIDNFADGLNAFAIGAVAGAVGAATGGAAFVAAGGAAGGAGGFLAGASGGAIGAGFGATTESIGNTLYFNDPLITPQEFMLNVATGSALGGSINGVTALKNGRTFLTGTLSPNQNTTITAIISETTTKSSQQLGKEGEEAANLPVGKGKIESPTGTANYRIPDGLDVEQRILYEVKNIQYQGYTKQIQDFVLYSQKEGYTFILIIRKETILSQPLKDALKLIPSEIRRPLK